MENLSDTVYMSFSLYVYFFFNKLWGICKRLAVKRIFQSVECSVYFWFAFFSLFLYFKASTNKISLTCSRSKYRRMKELSLDLLKKCFKTLSFLRFWKVYFSRITWLCKFKYLWLFRYLNWEPYQISLFSFKEKLRYFTFCSITKLKFHILFLTIYEFDSRHFHDFLSCLFRRNHMKLE